MQDAEALERVQKAAINLVPLLRKYRYEERLKRLGIPSIIRTEKIEW